jgi:excisionase family DNA binding protein
MQADIPQTQQDLPALLTVKELAEYMNVPVRTVRFWRENGDGPPAFRVGKRLYFRAHDVAAWLDEQAASNVMGGVTPEPDDIERLGDAEAFAAELERLAELAPEPWRDTLLSLIEREAK